MSGDIDARLARLADIEAIIRLKHEYWNHNDSGFRADEIAALFTADGIWSNAEFGQYEGREAIRAFFKNAPAIVPFCAHVGMNPIIDLDRDQATGRWRALLLSTLNEPSGAVAKLILIDYLDEFRRIDGVWRIRKLDILFNFVVPFGDSWVGLEKSRPFGNLRASS
jgi:hypothetical protein